MKFFAIAATLIAAVSAFPAADEECSVVYVTKTVTVPAGAHTPVPVTSSAAAVVPPYPTAPVPSAANPAPTGSVPGAAVPSGAAPPAGGAAVPSGSVPYYPTGTAAAPKPSGTGAYGVPPNEFTGSASSFKAGGALAGAAAVVALFL